MKTRIVFILVMLVAVISCKKDPEIFTDSDDEHQSLFYDTVLNTYLIENFLFNNGTYWIYRDSATNVLDTCTVDSTVIGIQTYFQAGTPGNGNYTVYFKCAQNTKHCSFPCDYVICSRYLLMAGIVDNFNIFLFATYNDSINDFELGIHESFLPSYCIDTSTYSDVYRLYYQNNNSSVYPEIPDSGYYYMKTGVGIIRSEYYNHGQRSVYTLVDYSVN